MTAASPQHGRSPDRSTNGWARSDFSPRVRSRVADEVTQVGLVAANRMRHAKKEADAATPGGLAAEVRALLRAQREVRDADGEAAVGVALQWVRNCYIDIAASAVLLAERSTRPAT